jgi:hypothetical protein
MKSVFINVAKVSIWLIFSTLANTSNAILLLYRFSISGAIFPLVPLLVSDSISSVAPKYLRPMNFSPLGVHFPAYFIHPHFSFE